MKVRMLETRTGSPSGCNPVIEYQAGEVYDLPSALEGSADDLADVFVAESWADRVQQTQVIGPKETQVIKPARRKKAK